ncbi:MAG: hypothetical protein P8107_13515 [Spirochaetia bacterium]
MKRIFIISISVFLLQLLNCVNTNNTISYETNDYRILKKAEYFATGGIGYSGEAPEAIIAFKHIFNSKNAKEQFIALLSEATYEGRLYALCGLYYHDYKRYAEEINLYKNSVIEIQLFSGCERFKDSIKNIIEKQNKSTVRLKDNKQSIEEWAEEYHVDLSEGFEIDFIGGGIPVVLVNYIKSNDERIKFK